jgi:hypothetical protein
MHFTKRNSPNFGGIVQARKSLPNEDLVQENKVNDVRSAFNQLILSIRSNCPQLTPGSPMEVPSCGGKNIPRRRIYRLAIPDKVKLNVRITLKN